jgi:hypothetical protein
MTTILGEQNIANESCTHNGHGLRSGPFANGGNQVRLIKELNLDRRSRGNIYKWQEVDNCRIRKGTLFKKNQTRINTASLPSFRCAKIHSHLKGKRNIFATSMPAPTSVIIAILRHSRCWIFNEIIAFWTISRETRVRSDLFLATVATTCRHPHYSSDPAMLTSSISRCIRCLSTKPFLNLIN